MAEEEPSAKRVKVIDATDTDEENEEGSADGDVEDATFNLLAKLQDELDQLDAKAAEQVRQIDQEFSLKRRSVYTKRRECTAVIPEFWSQSLTQHPYILECMTGDDQEIMAYLQEVVVDACPGAEDDPASFSINLTFEDNPFLFAQTLTKSFEHQRSLELFKVTASGVQWKPEHDPATQAGGEAGAQDVPASFFSWFSVDMALETEYDAIAAAFVDQLWPDPVRWYLGDPEAQDQLGECRDHPSEYIADYDGVDSEDLDSAEQDDEEGGELWAAEPSTLADGLEEADDDEGNVDAGDISGEDGDGGEGNEDEGEEEPEPEP